MWRLDPTNRPNEVVHVRPPPTWAELLMGPNSWDWLETLLQATRCACRARQCACTCAWSHPVCSSALCTQWPSSTLIVAGRECTACACNCSHPESWLAAAYTYTTAEACLRPLCTARLQGPSQVGGAPGARGAAAAVPAVLAVGRHLPAPAAAGAGSCCAR